MKNFSFYYEFFFEDVGRVWVKTLGDSMRQKITCGLQFYKDHV